MKIWCNIDKTDCCFVKKFFWPRSLKDLQNIVKEIVIRQKTSLGIIGNGHSTSEIICPSQNLIKTQYLNSILKVSTEKNTVTVECGVQIETLNTELAKYGLQLQNNIFVEDVTMVGAMATGAHGTGRHASFSDMIESITFIDEKANVHKVSRTKDVKTFDALCTNIGLIGIIYSIKIKCEKMSLIYASRRFSTLNRILPIYKKLNIYYEHFQFLWNPFSDNVIVYTWSNNSKRQKFESVDNLKIVNEIDIAYLNLGEADSVDFKYRSLMFDSIVPVNPPDVLIDSDIFFDIDDLPDVLKDIKKLYFKYLSDEPNALDALIRFIEPSESYMNVSYSRNSVSVGVATLGYERFKKFYRELNDLLVDKYKGRPHWGKINFLTRNSVKNIYQQSYYSFIDIIEKYNSKRLIGSKTQHNLFGR